MNEERKIYRAVNYDALACTGILPEVFIALTEKEAKICQTFFDLLKEKGIIMDNKDNVFFEEIVTCPLLEG